MGARHTVTATLSLPSGRGILGDPRLLKSLVCCDVDLAHQDCDSLRPHYFVACVPQLRVVVVNLVLPSCAPEDEILKKTLWHCVSTQGLSSRLGNASCFQLVALFRRYPAFPDGALDIKGRRVRRLVIESLK